MSENDEIRDRGELFASAVHGVVDECCETSIREDPGAEFCDSCHKTHGAVLRDILARLLAARRSKPMDRPTEALDMFIAARETLFRGVTYEHLDAVVAYVEHLEYVREDAYGEGLAEGRSEQGARADQAEGDAACLREVLADLANNCIGEGYESKALDRARAELERPSRPSRFTRRGSARSAYPPKNP